MDANDLGWIRDLGLSTRRESGVLSGLDWTILAFPETALHHENRSLYRLAVFAKGSRSPLFSLDLERDILGEFRLSQLAGGVHRILVRYETPPAYEAFRDRALAEAAAILGTDSEAKPATGRSAGPPESRH